MSLSGFFLLTYLEDNRTLENSFTYVQMVKLTALDVHCSHTPFQPFSFPGGHVISLLKSLDLGLESVITVVECLPGKYKTLNSNCSTTINK
jgi:hypothetical protein